MSTCKYCRRWQEADPRLISYLTDENKNPYSERFCPKVNKRIRSDHPSCPELKVAKYFHCNNLSERVSVIVCLARQGKLKKRPRSIPSDCINCFLQSGEVAELTRGRNLFIEHGYIKKKTPPVPLRPNHGRL